MTLNQKKAGYGVNTVLILAILAGSIVLSYFGGDTMRLKYSSIVWQCCYLIILAASLNLVVGFLGQLNLGHCGFMGIGAYTAALISLAFQRAGFYETCTGVNFFLVLVLCIIAAGVLSGLVGLLVGIPALRLKGDYLAIITLGFGMIIVNVINNLPFAGQDGLALGSASSSLYATGLGFSSNLRLRYMWIAVLVTVLCLICMFMFVRSKYGRAIKAIRDDDIAAASSGINVSYYKILTFSASAFFAGIAGALYACCMTSLSTGSFSFSSNSILNSIFIVVMVVVGGMGSLTGSIVSAVGMFFLNYQIKNGAWVKALPGFVQNVFEYPMLVYSVILIIVIMFRPKGIFGTYEFSPVGTVIAIRDKLKNKKTSKGGKAE
ncbi:MAG: branched-chain amino acid ABC transporter permease [Ruminococcaceae bacterium]|nr:branched-chain amino acid ABC transporter permease [Oscillospiraceae bacterium]